MYRFLARAADMSRDRVTSNQSELPQRPPMEDSSSSIKECADALLDAFRRQLEAILLRARDHERSMKESLENVTLLTREEAAQRLRMSSSQLDLLVKQGAISAIKFDRRPRFKVAGNLSLPGSAYPSDPSSALAIDKIGSVSGGT